MTVRVLCLAMLLAGAFLTNHAEAASFDCRKASTATEKLICADGNLSSLDEKLQKTYQAALTAVAPSDKKELIAEQRNWIRYTRDICSDAACLGKVYAARIDLLSKTEGRIINEAECSIPEGKSCRSVLYYRDPSYRIASFNKTLASNKRSARVIGCDRLIDLPVGFANSNDSYGGYCTVIDGATRSRVMICNDDMLGHFAIQPAKDGLDDDKKLIEFTNEHCFGG